MSDAEPWRRLHPLSPVLRGGVFLVAVTGYLLSKVWDRIVAAIGLQLPGSPTNPGGDEVLLERPLIALAGVLGVLVVIVAAAWLSWRNSRYRIGNGQLEYRHGLIMRQHRQVPVERIQSVGITRPILARLFGLSQVVVSSAGGLGSSLTLAFLSVAEAEAVRSELQRLSGRESGAGAPRPPDGDPDALDRPGGIPTTQPGVSSSGHRTLVAVPNPRLVAAAVLHPSMVLLAALGLGAAVMLSLGWPLSLGFVVPVAFGLGMGRVGELLKNGNFTLVDDGSTVSLAKGLTELRATTVPVERIQALQLTQNVLWRRFGWWRITVNVAGSSILEGGEATSMLLPVGTRAETALVVARLLPDIDAGLLDSALQGGPGTADWTLISPRARILDPLLWRHAGYAATASALLLRRGRLTRSVVIVPHARIQSLEVSQGPLDRTLGLATVALHSTVGPITPTIEHLAVDDAERLFHDQAQRARNARRPGRTGCEQGTASAPLVLVTHNAPSADAP